MAPLLHRLPKALLVAALTALVFGGLLGTVQAAGDQTGTDAKHLQLARPAIGDRWSYQAVLGGPWKVGEDDQARVGQPFSFAELEWLNPLLVRDANGSEAAVDLLHLRRLDYSDSDDLAEMRDGHYWVPQEDRFLYSLGRPEVLAHESRIKSQRFGSTGQNGIGVGGVTAVQTDDDTVVEGWSRSFQGFGEGACMTRTSVQDKPFDLDDGLEVAAWDCLPTFPDSWPGSGMFHFAARELVAGYDAFRFDGHAASVWLSPAVPVPVQIKGWDESRVATLTLSSFHAGHAALGGLSPKVGSSVAPPVALAARQPWGPDDSGVDHPWPASAAYLEALADASWPTLRQWTAAHPDGVTFWLEYAEDLDAVPHQRAWFFGLSDGQASFAFIVSRSSFDALPLPGTLRYQDMGFMSIFLDALSPDPDLLPAEIPTVASVLARWESYEALEGRPTSANGWGMGIYCVVDCQYGVFGDVVAGRDPVAIMNMEGFMGGSLAPSGILERTFTGSQLDVDPSGETTGLVNWTGYDSGLSVSGLASQAPVDPTAKPSPEKRSLVLGAIFLPTPEQGAAITVASALAGLLYWLWPTLKGGGAGLFSRLTGPRLLEHPARARLVDLVQAEPGVHFQDLVRKSGLANGTAIHHLRKLDAAGLVSVRPFGRYTCYFPGSSPDRASLAAAPVTRSDGARRILAELKVNPGLSGQEVALRLGLQQSTVSYHVKRLQDVGLVAAQRDGRVVRFRALAKA